MNAQVRTDGSHFEQSSYYHVYATDMFLFHHILAPAPPSYVERLAAMAEYLSALVDEEGVMPLIGDDDGGRFFYPYGCRRRFGRATLATCAVALNRADLALDTADIWEQAVWWLGSATLRVQPTPSRRVRTNRLYPGAGMAVFRNSQTHLTFDAGPFGKGSGGHSHADTLSITVRHRGEDVLADAGTFTYVSDPECRRWFRGTPAHNTVRINGRDQAIQTGPFRWIAPPVVRVIDSHGQDDMIAECSYAGFTHRRSVRFTQGLIIVEDSIKGPNGEHEIEQFWHAGAGVTITQEGASSRVYGVGTHARLAIALDSGITIEHGNPNGWISTAFGSRQEASVVVVRWYGRLPLRLDTVIALQPAPELHDPTLVPAWAQAALRL
jgi:hypothetical protein